MNNQKHKSIFKIDAGLTAALIYLVSLFIIIVIPSGSTFAWIISLAILFLESKSIFVRFHAAQCFLFMLVSGVLLYILNYLIFRIGGLAIFYALAIAFRIAILVIIGFLIKSSFDYRFTALPLIGDLANKVANNI